MAKYAGRELVLTIGDQGTKELQAVVLVGFGGIDSFKLTYGAQESAIITNGTNYDAAGIKAAIEAITGVTFTVTVSDVTLTGFLVQWDVAAARTDLTVTTPVGATGSVGTLVEGAAPGASFQTIGQVTALGNAGSARDLIDASAYGDDWKDYVVGQQDGNEIEVEVAYSPADLGHVAVQTAYTDGLSSQFGMSHADSGFDVTFPALVTKFERGAELAGLLKMAATLKILNPGVVDV